MKEQNIKVTLKKAPGLSWRREELYHNLAIKKANPKLSSAFDIGAIALKKHVTLFYRDFGADSDIQAN